MKLSPWRASLCCCGLLLVVGALPAAAQQTTPGASPGAAPSPVPSYAGDPKFQAALQTAQQSMQDRQMRSDDRLSRWRKADKLSGNQCVDCLHQITILLITQQAWKDAVAVATRWSALASTPADKILSGYMRGSALLQYNNGNPKPDALREADAAFQSVLQIAPHNKAVLFDEGRVLARQGRDEEARAMFASYVKAAGPTDRYSARAAHFTEDPHLAAMPMAPPFTLTTTAGEQINLDQQVGKVVLLDFWATWCGPCKQTLPEIHTIAKKFAGEPLVVISISSDQDAEQWKQFVDKNDMFWAQYRDETGALRQAYGVSSIPRFFTIDSDGVLQSVRVGSDANIEGDLKKLIKRASEAEQKKAQATERPAGL